MPEFFKTRLENTRQTQQGRLNSKLKERLGYLGIYSQRNYQLFFDNLSSLKQEIIVRELKIEYRQIITSYFVDENKSIEQVDRFVEKAFFINLPVAKVVEIHLDLIEDLTRKLKLEGSSTVFLSDYRLVLIDVIAHLGEMYRRAIEKTCFLPQIVS